MPWPKTGKHRRFRAAALFSDTGMSKTDGGRREAVISEHERSNFVEEVLSGKLSPDVTQVAYHFAGVVDKGKEKVQSASYAIRLVPTSVVCCMTWYDLVCDVR